MTTRKLLNSELGRKSVEEFKEGPKIPVVIVLDNVRSLNNVGSVFRTADAFSAEAVYLCGITGVPPHKEIQKTALGATESVSWKYFENTMLAIAELKENHYRIVSVEQAEQATQLEELAVLPGQKIAVVFGNEVKGVEQEVVSASDEVVEIPQSGTKHSLNVAVSAGVVVWELYRKIK